MTSVLPEEVSRNHRREAEISDVASYASDFSSRVGPYLNWIYRPMVTEMEVFLFTMAMVLGAQYNGWNTSLNHGYWLTFVNLLYVGTNYICLSVCLAEMSSALPFSGGIYGFIRATIGPFYGFVVASLEILLCICYVSVIVRDIIDIPSNVNRGGDDFRVGMAILTYGAIAMMCVSGGKIFWAFNSVLGCMTILLVLVFLLASLGRIGQNVDFEEYCGNIPSDFSYVDMLTHLQIANSAYLGIQYIPLMSEFLSNPKTQVPRIMMVSIFLLIVTAVSLMTAACSQSPGGAVIANGPQPLQYGFGVIFMTDHTNGIWLHGPPMFGSCFGFIYCSGKQLYSIAKSSLLPKVFTNLTPHLNTPYVGFVSLCVLCCMVTSFGVFYHDIIIVLHNLASVASQMIFVTAFIAYFFFRFNLSELNRSFRNPLGIYAAIYGILVYAIGFVGVTFLNGFYGWVSLVICVIYLMVVTVFYFTYMIHRQSFSEEEKQLMFKAYLINANQQNRKRGRKAKIAPARSVQGSRSVVSKQSVEDQESVFSGSESRVPSESKVNGESVVSDHLAPQPGRTVASLTAHVMALETNQRSSKLSKPQSLNSTNNMVEYISEKMGHLLQTSSKEMKEYQQLAIIATGGYMENDLLQSELEKEVGIQKDDALEEEQSV